MTIWQLDAALGATFLLAIAYIAACLATEHVRPDRDADDRDSWLARLRPRPAPPRPDGSPTDPADDPWRNR